MTDLAQSHTSESTRHFSKDKKCDSHTCCGSCHSGTSVIDSEMAEDVNARKKRQKEERRGIG